MEATPNHTPRATQRMDYVLLHRRTSSVIHPKTSEELVSSHPESLYEQPRSDQLPMGRGHRVKKPNIRLSSALSEVDGSENEPRRPRSRLKPSRPVSSVDTVQGPRRWCHQCHQDRSNQSTIACAPCGKFYCYSCMARRYVVCTTLRPWCPVSHSITRRYGERITEDQHDGWTCPRCQNYCDCIKCIRIRKMCGTSSPSAQTLPATRRVWGESRLTRARAKKESVAAPSHPLVSPPELTAATGADQEWLPHEDALYVAPGETAKNVGGWTPAEFQDTDNGSYKPLAFQTYLDLASDSTLLSTPTSSSALPSPPHTSLHSFAPDDSAFDPLKALRIFPSANDAPPYAISPLELTSDFCSMLTYTSSPTIPQTIVDEYGITGVVPINRPVPESLPNIHMKHGALMLFDAVSAEASEQDTPFDKERPEYASGSSSDPGRPPSSLLGDVDVDTMSRFLNNEMFDESS